MTEATTASLRNVFGPLSHEPPAPTEAEKDAKERAEAQAQAVMAEDLPAKAKIHQKTDVLLVPSKRIDGSSEDPPWMVPEPILWDWLRQVPIEHIEERHLDGLNSSFWARYRNRDGQLRSALLKFGGLGRDHVYELWGTQFMLDPEKYDVLRRELAAYEAAKACGMEDMVAPLAAREVNLVPLISDSVRDRLSVAMRIPSHRGGREAWDYWATASAPDLRPELRRVLGHAGPGRVHEVGTSERPPAAQYPSGYCL